MAGKSRIGEVYLQVAPVLDGMSDSIAEQVSDGMKEANKETVNQSEEVGEETGKGMAKGVAAAAAAGAIATAIGAQFIKGYENAIEQMGANKDITANLNLDAGQSEMVSESIKELYTSGMGESYTEVAESMESIVGTIQGAREATADELSKMGRDMSNLTSQYGVDAAEISKAVNGMIGTGFAADAEEAFQIVHDGFQTLGDHGDDWAEILAEYSGDFTQFGLTGEQATALARAGLDAGMFNVDLWSDALREMDIKLQSRDNDEIYEKFGLDPDKLRAQIKEGGPVAQEAFKEMFAVMQQSGDVAEMFGLGGTQFEDFRASIEGIDLSVLETGLGDTTQSLDEFNEVVNSGIGHEFAEIQRTFEQAFADAMIPILEAILPILQSFATLLSENEWILQILVPILGVALVAALVVLAASLWAVAAAGWAAIAPFLPVIATVAAVIVGVILLVATIWWLVENWDAVWGVIKDVSGAVGDFFVGLWEGIAGWFVDLWNGIGQWFSDLWDGIADFFVGLWDGVIGWFQDAWTGVGNFFTGLWDGILNYFVGIYETIKNLISDVIESVPGGTVIVEGINTVGRAFGLPQLAEGGTIPARKGGTVAVLGEAGRDEVVMDKGKWNRLLDQINRDGTDKNNGTIIDVGGITVYQQPGESTEELLERMNNSLDFNGLRS